MSAERRVALLVMTDGRDELLEQTLASITTAFGLGAFAVRLMIDDTGDPAHGAELARRYPRFMVDASMERRGFAGAIARGWELLTPLAPDYVLHVEDDFTFNGSPGWAPSLLASMIEVLELEPRLAQVALKRQPWNDAERAAGGIVEQHPDDYTEFAEHGVIWTEHRRFFTTNPCLYRGALMARGWPLEPRSEGVFSLRLFEDPSTRCAFLGGKLDAPLVTHIGDERNGTGY